MSGVNILSGAEDFAELRMGRYYYVDKTDFLNRFLSPLSSKVALFTRPRRFGKTLFLSMLSEFLDITKNSRKLFASLKVAENKTVCKEWMNQYPVVFLSLKRTDAATFELALADIQLVIREYCMQHKYLLDSDLVTQESKEDIQAFLDRKADISLLATALRSLTMALSDYHHGKKVILLIDEYDAPTTKAAERGYYDEMLLFIRVFLSNALKSNTCLKFGILTGVLPSSKQTLSSDLNNLDCFDLATNKYADVFGFTQGEVDKLLACAGLDGKREILRDWYDGYRFGRQQKIYCPWSIMKYLDSLKDNPEEEPSAYWVGASGNELAKGVHGRLTTTILDDMTSLADGQSIAAYINEDLNYNQVYTKKDNFWTLLYLTGFLTPVAGKEGRVAAFNDEQTILAIPNREVRKAFEKEIKSWFEEIVLEDDLQDSFFELFWDGDATNFEQKLHEKILLSSSFRDYRYREYFYHSLLLGVFLLKYTVTSNREVGNGIFDLTVLDEENKRAAVIEVKRAQSEAELDFCVAKALRQIEERQYDVELRARGYTKILHWGMAFFKKSCKM